MAEEFENKEVQSEQNENSRDGYSAAEQGSYQREYRAAGRPQRPRIHTQRAYSTDNSSNNNEEGGFRPEGFGSGLQSTGRPQQGSYRPRQNNYGGYNNRGGYNSRPQQQGGYRPRYNNNNGEEGGYQPRQAGYNNRGGYNNRPQQGGYRPRYNNNEEGGYQTQAYVHATTLMLV